MAMVECPNSSAPPWGGYPTIVDRRFRTTRSGASPLASAAIGPRRRCNRRQDVYRTSQRSSPSVALGTNVQHAVKFEQLPLG